jgi:arylsulfatase A-like enzyme
MSLFTGVEPISHGLVDYPNAGRLGGGYVTMAAFFRAHGFRTAAFTGGGFVSPRHGFDEGFETFESRGRRFEDNMPAVEAWVAGLQRSERFFLFLHGFNVHKPYKPPPPYDRRFCPDYAGDYDTANFQPEKPRPSAEDLEYVIAQYDGEIAYVDELLGDFFDRLNALGILGETLVVVTSDHGDEMYDHGMVDHIHTLYDELVRVPLIMFGPRVPARVVGRHLAQIDLYPTVCELMGLPLDVPMQAVSRAVLLDRSAEQQPDSAGFYDDPVFSFTGFSEYPYHVSSVRTNRWKLQVWSLAGMKRVTLPEPPNRPRYTYKFRDRAEDFVELFDLVADPGEHTNLAGKYPEVVEQLARLLHDRTAESRAFAHAPANAPQPTPDYIEALRALGYLQDSSSSRP